MVLDRARELSEKIFDPVARRLARFNPNTVSWIAFVLAAFGAVLLAGSSTGTRDLLIGAFAFILMSGIFDALDGAIARVSGKGSQKGDFLDHVLDRYADIALILGFTFSFYSSGIALGMFALIGVFMTSYLGTQAQAIGLKRNYGGILGRADRIVYMLIAVIVEYLYGTAHYGPHGATFLFLTPFEWLLLFFGIAGNLTAVWRAVASWKQI